MKTNEKKKNNKKVLVIAGMAALLALVGYMGGSTFAKYLTQQEVQSQSATVAKWGYVVKIDANKLFGDAYKEDVKVAYGTENVEVKAATADNNVLAPGTEGSFDIDVTGKAEVLSKLTVSTTFTSDVHLTNDGTTAVDYYPIKWTVAGDVKIGGTDKFTEDKSGLTTQQMLATLADFSNLTSSIAPNTDIVVDLTVSWAWAFEQGADANAIAQNNVYDTMLGDLAAGDTLVASKYGAAKPEGTTQVNFDVKVVVEQLDK